MHTQSEQKKAQISRNDMYFKHLRDFIFFLHFMRYHKYQPGTIICFLQTIVVKEVTHRYHKYRVFEKRESYIGTFFIFFKIYTPHCAFLTLSKMLRLITLYKNIWYLWYLWYLLVYPLISHRVIHSACLVHRWYFSQNYGTSHNVRGGMLGFVTQGAHHTCKKHTLKN
jgi:hypothetical protein